MRLTATVIAAATVGCGADGTGAVVQTWGHANAELNDTTPVAAGNVRRSTVYDVRVASVAAPAALQDSFTYMSLPRSGRAKEGYSEDDGAEFASRAGLTMSWTSFLYSADVWVYVDLKQAPALTSADAVKIRPSTLDFHRELVNASTVRILVPYATQGHRFSVEFDSQQLTTFEARDGSLTTSSSGNPVVHTEPRNALMVFAEPMLTGADVDRLVPNPATHSIHYPVEGRVSNLHEVTQEVIYFGPGTYYMESDYHAQLRPEVHWVYLAPGAYVKGAFEFGRGSSDFKVTGFGALSGEQYVYEADAANGYRHRAHDVPDCHGSCVKMLEFGSGGEERHLTVHGITLANPPYHSFVVFGDVSRFSAEASHTKQVGGWYWQTDGPELYNDSSLAHSFVHANDDVLKLYGSRVHVGDVVVWKAENGPVLQWGWQPRNIDDVHVNGVDVIHNRMHRDDHNSCILNSARHFADPSSSALADPQARVTDLLFENIRAEGRNLCAMRLYALASWENIEIVNLSVEEWNELDPARQASRFEALTNERGERVFIGNEVADGRGLALVNYLVGTEAIRKSAENWQHDRPGRLDFDPSLWESWDAR